MTLLDAKEVLNLKLRSIPAASLRDLAKAVGTDATGSAAKVAERVLSTDPPADVVDEFIRKEYLRNRIEARRKIIPDEEIKRELLRVDTFSWGAVQGQLDQKIQTEYVRRFVRFDQLLEAVKRDLYDEVTSYVICTWFNHWTTVLIEEHIAMHPRVVPTLKPVKGLDIFFCGQPFDLKVTYLPRGYDPKSAIRDPRRLAIWLYENQGAQRFGAENRIFVVLFDEQCPADSWKLKMSFDLVFQSIDQFFDHEDVSSDDEIAFTFGGKTYRTVSKMLLVTKQ